MTAFNRRSVRLFVRGNQIIIGLVLIRKVKQDESFQFLFFKTVFASNIGKDLLEINFLLFSLIVRRRRSLHFHCERSQSVVIFSKIAKNRLFLI